MTSTQDDRADVLDDRVVVVGGGMVGLTVALRLAQAGRRVTVLEAASELGGLASGWELPSPAGDGTTLRWDRYYHVVLGSDDAYRGVLRELGLDDRISWTSTGTGASSQGRLHPVSRPLDLLRFPPLPLVSRVRLGLTVLAAGRGDVAALDDVPIEPWLRRRSGDAAYERFWRPQLRAKVGTSHHDVSAAFLAATATRLLRARRNGVGAEQFGHLPGGTSTVLDALAARLRSLGASVETGARVERVEPGSSARLRIRVDDGRVLDAHDAVLTVPSGAIASMVAGLEDGERERLRAVRYQGVLCASLMLRRPLSRYYLTYLLDDSVLTGIVDMAALTGTAAFGGGTIVYLPRYQAPDDPLFDARDDEVIAQFTDALAAAYPSFDRRDVVGARVARAREVFAVPTVGASRRVVKQQMSVPGVHVVNSSQIQHATLNIDESVRLAERAAAAVLGTAVRAPAEPGVARRFASLSLDLDNEWSYLMVRGEPSWQSYPTYLPTVVPRALQVLRDLDARITFFVVGRDADDERNTAALRAIVDAGHEIGNHSYQHEPWLHTYTYEKLVADFDRAEAALERLTGRRPDGFRGPGYSLAPDVLRLLGARGYRYDASTLPTVIGPLARAFYFRAAKLDAAQREERSLLFGTWRDGLRPLRSYTWPVPEADGGQLLEIPVTTLPFARVPIHVSYLLSLAQINPLLARTYFATALRLCELRGVAPSILLHPLDFAGADEVPSLAFFPAMAMPSAKKAALVRSFLQQLASRFEIVPMGEHARRVTSAGPLPIRNRDDALRVGGQ